jgi:hypothetical protein
MTQIDTKIYKREDRKQTYRVTVKEWVDYLYSAEFIRGYDLRNDQI